MSSRSIDRPDRAALGRIAENQPGLLNLLLAYFVFEWQEVRIGTPPHGIDQTGEACLVPDYISAWEEMGTDDCPVDGVSAAVHYLLQAPARRDAGEPGFVSVWLKAEV